MVAHVEPLNSKVVDLIAFFRRISIKSLFCFTAFFQSNMEFIYKICFA